MDLDTYKELPCRNCIALPMCYQRVLKKTEEFQIFLDNPYNVSMKHEKDIIVDMLVGDCSIIKDFTEEEIKVRDGIGGWKIPNGKQEATIIIRSANHRNTIFEFFCGETKGK